MGASRGVGGFVFTEGFDRDRLRELYGDDLRMAEDIFESACRSLSALIPEVEAGAAKAGLQDLRRWAHHTRPLLGYLGLPSPGEDGAADSDASAPFGAGALARTLREAMERAEAELQRLKTHNRACA